MFYKNEHKWSNLMLVFLLTSSDTPTDDDLILFADSYYFFLFEVQVEGYMALNSKEHWIRIWWKVNALDANITWTGLTPARDTVTKKLPFVVIDDLGTPIEDTPKTHTHIWLIFIFANHKLVFFHIKSKRMYLDCPWNSASQFDCR